MILFTGGACVAGETATAAVECVMSVQGGGGVFVHFTACK